MLTILLAMLEDEEDQRKFLKLHTAYEQKLCVIHGGRQQQGLL